MYCNKRLFLISKGILPNHEKYFYEHVPFKYESKSAKPSQSASAHPSCLRHLHFQIKEDISQENAFS